MANLNAFPFDAINTNGVYDREYTSDDYASYFGKFIGNGIYAKNGNCLEVLANNNSMFVTVRDGSVFINGRARDWETESQLRIANAHNAYDRYDLIVARLNLIERNITLEVVEGTASATPAIPEATRTADVFDLVLAQVHVKTGVTKIEQANVSDKRSTSLCGFVTGLIDQIDAQSFFEQYHIAFNQEFSEYQAEFEAWFETIRGILGEDEVASLYAEFESFKNEINQAVANLPQYDLMMQSKTVTFTSAGWTRDASKGYYTQTVTVEGLATLSTPVISLNATGTAEQMIAQINAWGKVMTHETGDNSLTLYASEALSLDLSVSVKTTVDTDVDEIRQEIVNLKKSVSDGKSAVAGAITAKGVNTANDATFATMATNISKIGNAPKVKLNGIKTGGDGTNTSYSSIVNIGNKNVTVYAFVTKTYRGFDDYVELRGSNDQSTWTSIGRSTEHKESMVKGYFTGSGYLYYQIVSSQGAGSGSDFAYYLYTIE